MKIVNFLGVVLDCVNRVLNNGGCFNDIGVVDDDVDNIDLM